MSSILKAVNLDKSYGGVHAMIDFSVEIEEGEILGLIGPNGAGKSTFVNSVTGVIEIDAGEVIFDGEDITGSTPPEVGRKGIARTFQSSRPFPELTVKNNIAIAAMANEYSIEEAEDKAVDIAEKTGLKEFINTPAKSIPIEQRKRLDLARALGLDPKLLMLDEVMAGLNPSEMEKGLELIKKINSLGVSVLFIEHVIKAVVKLCDRVIVMDQGELLTQGKPQDVIEDERVIKAYLGGGVEDAKN